MLASPPRRPRHVLPLLALLVLGTAVQAQDAEKLMRKKNVRDRLRGIDVIERVGHPKAESLLQKAAGSRDWEVTQAAIEALGERGSKDSTKLLARLAIKAPVRNLRLAAVRTLQKLDPVGGALLLARSLKGSTGGRAAEALALLPCPDAAKNLKRLLKSKELRDRVLAARALGSTGTPEAVNTLKPLLQDADQRLQIGAVQGLGRSGRAEALPLLLGVLERKRLSDVMDRRVRRAIVENLKKSEADPETAVKACIESARRLYGTDNARRGVRLLSDLVAAKIPGAADAVGGALPETGLGHGRPQVRVAALRALVLARGAAAGSTVRKMVTDDASGLVRWIALQALLELEGGEAHALVAERISAEKSEAAREELAALAGRLHVTRAKAALRERLDDESWKVCTAAAISLGMMQDEAAVTPLVKMLKHENWRRRASAATGLGWCARKECVAPLIEALGDSDPTVKDCAQKALERITREDHGFSPKKWLAWWADNAAAFSFSPRNKPVVDEDGYQRSDGFRRDPYGVFKEIDVIVLTAANDALQNLLKLLEIPHRLTQMNQVRSSHLHSHAVFVSNCPGKISDDDAKRLEWFVHAGGHLIATCQAMNNTVARLFPGVIRARPQGPNGRGSVLAEPVDTEDPLIKDVIDRDVRPLYQLPGYAMIGVQNRARVNVILDSEEASALWGEGNLAAWFPLGHGLVFASTNHFTLQGLRGSRNLKTEKDRKAFAVEHLGYGYAELRELDRKGAFKTQAKAAKECQDLTILRLVARFVSLKRRASQ